MAEKTFRCRVVTPTEQLLNEDAVYASLPAHDGLLGVQFNRGPLITELGLGELRVDFPDTGKAHGGSRHFFIDGGFARVAENELIIIADKAIPAERLGATEAEQALEAALAKSVPQNAENPAELADEIRHEQDAARLKVRLAKYAREHGI
ncbi:MAG: F0F1 ATP synthase subunit epsilon [Phycisphaerales bacterium]|nr:F0F1 ATP synthase subunit epsilon [Phycisphaerales bacterium]